MFSYISMRFVEERARQEQEEQKMLWDIFNSAAVHKVNDTNLFVFKTSSKKSAIATGYRIICHNSQNRKASYETLPGGFYALVKLKFHCIALRCGRNAASHNEIFLRSHIDVKKFTAGGEIFVAPSGKIIMFYPKTHFYSYMDKAHNIVRKTPDAAKDAAQYSKVNVPAATIFGDMRSLDKMAKAKDDLLLRAISEYITVAGRWEDTVPATAATATASAGTLQTDTKQIVSDEKVTKLTVHTKLHDAGIFIDELRFKNLEHTAVVFLNDFVTGYQQDVAFRQLMELKATAVATVTTTSAIIAAAAATAAPAASTQTASTDDKHHPVVPTNK